MYICMTTIYAFGLSPSPVVVVSSGLSVCMMNDKPTRNSPDVLLDKSDQLGELLEDVLPQRHVGC